jgi:uncharacterized membrane protein
MKSNGCHYNVFDRCESVFKPGDYVWIDTDRRQTRKPMRGGPSWSLVELDERKYVFIKRGGGRVSGGSLVISGPWQIGFGNRDSSVSKYCVLVASLGLVFIYVYHKILNNLVLPAHSLPGIKTISDS